MKSYIVTLASMALGVMSAACEQNSATPPASQASATSVSAKKFDPVAGQWTGNAKIIVNWVQNTQVPITLTIDGAGNVSGTVGDATLADAKINTRTAMMNRDYRVHARLVGKLIAAENVQRDAIDILFDRSEGDTLVGGFHSSGTEFGGRKSMKVSASDLVLTRAGSSDAAAAAARTPAPTTP